MGVSLSWVFLYMGFDQAATSAADTGKAWEGAGKVPLQGCEFSWKTLVIFCNESVSMVVWMKLFPMGSGVLTQGP